MNSGVQTWWIRTSASRSRAISTTSQRAHPGATGELTGILNQIALAAKIVSREVNKAGLVELLGLTGEENVQGEEVKKLDEYANDVFIHDARATAATSA